MESGSHVFVIGDIDWIAEKIFVAEKRLCVLQHTLARAEIAGRNRVSN